MECSKINKWISPFLNDELSEKTTGMVLNHLKECPECKRETETYYMIREAQRLMDDGEGDFNLRRSFEEFLLEKKEKRRKTVLFRAGLVFLGILVSVGLYFAIKELL